jgi:FixJ family two-component response regulator
MSPFRRGTIAIVDDDLRVLEALENLLESAGHSVRLFQSAEDFLAGHSLSEIDCLIADIGMPTVDGFELQRLAKAARPELPIILVTGRHELAQRASEQRNQWLFEKPFDGPAMLAAVTQALGASPQGE